MSLGMKFIYEKFIYEGNWSSFCHLSLKSETKDASS